jgi:hypothetical protein
MDLILTLDSQKTNKAFIVETYKRILTKVSNLYYDESVVLPSHHFTYAT